MPYSNYVAADVHGSAADLALANLQQQTNAHAQLLAHMRGAKRTRRRQRRRRRAPKTKRRTRATRRRRGGAVAFTMPHNVVDAPAGQTNYPVQSVLSSLLATGSQHAENSRYDGEMHAAPRVIGGKKRK
jgi:hypothetical protein